MLESSVDIKYNDVKFIVSEEVDNVRVIDVHSHLFPDDHGNLFLYGFDNLMTYHYLIAELFMIWNEKTPEEFYKLSKQEQSNIIWLELFVKRSPISEATRGILTTCKILGIQPDISNVGYIRTYFNNIVKIHGKEEYIKHIFEKSNVEYTIMTNQIFNKDEIEEWEKNPKSSNFFKTSLRVDQLILDHEKCYQIIEKFGYEPTLEGMKNYIRLWYHKISPEYFMASLPYDFKYDENNNNFAIDNIIIPLTKELNLPVAFKFGTKRGLNSELKDAGDGVGVASVEALANLCKKFNKTKFLATFLSQVNQHQLCVVARKFGNLHIYGCWWFLNNPSLIEQITRMRIEMLGLGFTVQHSDARVLEQLLYKWKHSREIIKKVLIEKYQDLFNTGWKLTKDDIKRDVYYLFRGSYEKFMEKIL